MVSGFMFRQVRLLRELHKDAQACCFYCCVAHASRYTERDVYIYVSAKALIVSGQTFVHRTCTEPEIPVYRSVSSYIKWDMELPSWMNRLSYTMCEEVQIEQIKLPTCSPVATHAQRLKVFMIGMYTVLTL